MSIWSRLRLGFKALRELGIAQTGLYALYHLGLRSGLWQHQTPVNPTLPALEFPRLWAESPSRAEFQRVYRDFMARYPEAADALLIEANEIVSGRVRLFGAVPVKLRLAPTPPLQHWTTYERGALHGGGDPDIKLIWEPARLGWVYPLARAYMLTGELGYAHCFWRTLAHFFKTNPPNLGPNWVSAQEVAIRITAIAFGLRVFDGTLDPSTALYADVAPQLATHAARIPPTMLYARAQHNNHLLTEAAGLITAGLVLSDHPHAQHWRVTGWKWLERGLRTQIAEDGTYAQHSTNYHRLMLQTALWAGAILSRANSGYAHETKERLAAATRWLLARCDRESGRASNLGANDGAYFFPLADGGFADYRPVLQAAARAYLGAPAFPPGAWDEYALWLNWLAGLPLDLDATPLLTPQRDFNRLDAADSWGRLRAARFTSRPSHADQLHVDLWRRGQPIALDAGSYRYTALPPWDNALASTAVHNTVTVDGLDQMTRAGRFLWLDWAQSKTTSFEPGLWIEAEHSGYTKSGIIHRRRLERLSDTCWRVTDQLSATGSRTRPHIFQLHWLLVDGEWQLDGNSLSINTPVGHLRMDITCSDPSVTQAITLVRSGICLYGDDPQNPTLGWHAPTYNDKKPALSLRVTFTSHPPVQILTEFTFLD